MLFVSLTFHTVTRGYTYLNKPAAKAIGLSMYNFYNQELKG